MLVLDFSLLFFSNKYMNLLFQMTRNIKLLFLYAMCKYHLFQMTLFIILSWRSLIEELEWEMFCPLKRA